VRRRPRRVPVGVFDAATQRWIDVDTTGAVDRSELTLTTFNIWFNDLFAEERYRAIADILSRITPDIMVFQEVTPTALRVLLAAPWIRQRYLRMAVAGEHVGNYGMLMLSCVPVERAHYTRLPTRLGRGYLRADFTINGTRTTVCSVHLDSGKRSSRRRARQLRVLFRAVRGERNAVLLGDFNMRDDENSRIVAPFVDVWPALRPGDPGFTEDTSINLMRFDMKNKHRQVRFDRVLIKAAGWTPAAIGLLGTDPVPGTSPRIFPSDHFGVWCRLVGGPAPPTAAPQRRWKWLRARRRAAAQSTVS